MQVGIEHGVFFQFVALFLGESGGASAAWTKYAVTDQMLLGNDNVCMQQDADVQLRVLMLQQLGRQGKYFFRHGAAQRHPRGKQGIAGKEKPPQMGKTVGFPNDEIILGKRRVGGVVLADRGQSAVKDASVGMRGELALDGFQIIGAQEVVASDYHDAIPAAVGEGGVEGGVAPLVVFVGDDFHPRVRKLAQLL